ncbi:hypothetical protein L1987_74803 [Smallanthus sonchifolius]|uniref:Uncharacterized protein n=1 Tax=Smallanthus sonchifolius TaxID=185202 RepID=A0ACB9A3Y1_9ASTR|nr:hypothetical protein L1987_74803 [Smallanthus sonchifolius]
MNHPFATVHLHNLTFTAFVGPTDDLDLVVFADGDGSDVVLAPEFGGERCAHQHTADARRRGEMRLPAFPARAGDSGIVLHLSLPRSAVSRVWELKNGDEEEDSGLIKETG